MKQACIFFFLLYSVALQAQTDSVKAQLDTAVLKLDTAKIKLLKLPDSTGFGTLFGKAVIKEIGSSGGPIASEDGRIELIFPEGALSANTNISVQPVTNMLNSTGNAYKLEPSGIEFQVPVKMIFHYTDEEAETCPPDLKGFALQDSRGRWSFFEYEDWDSLGKTLSGAIHHFTTLDANVNEIYLNPERSRIAVGETTNLAVLQGLRSLGPSHSDIFRLSQERKPGWFVNGIVGGNQSVGTAYTDWFVMGSISGTYKAPRYLPGRNPVQVKLAYQYFSKKRNKIVWGSSKCDITIFDTYRVTISKKGPFVLECGAQLEDMSHFTLKFYSNEKPEIFDIINAPPTLISPPNCRGETRGGRSGLDYPLSYDPVGCVGPIHVNAANLTGYGMTISETGPPDITIDFSETYVKIMNRKGKFPEEKKEVITEVKEMTIGNKVKFKANRSHQDLTIGGNGTYGYRLIIDPL